MQEDDKGHFCIPTINLKSQKIIEIGLLEIGFEPLYIVFANPLACIRLHLLSIF